MEKTSAEVKAGQKELTLRGIFQIVYAVSTDDVKL
jgi:hypothetical protein